MLILSRRKDPTYNEVVRQIEILETKKVEIREQTVHDFDAVLDDSMIAIMGDLSSPERRKALKLALQNLGSCVDQVKADRRPRSDPKIKADHTSKSVPKPAEKPAQTAAKAPEATAQARPLLNGVMKFNEDRGAWGIWDNDVKGWYLSVVKQGTQLEVDDYGQWVKTSFEIEREKPARDAGYFPLGIWNNMTTRNLCYEGLRVRSVQSAQ